MMIFLLGLFLGKFVTGSWWLGFAIGVLCSIFLGDDDPEDPDPHSRK